MIFSIILLAHWLGDYVFQSSEMALNKHKSIQWLSLHVLVYSTVILSFAFFLFPINEALMYALLNGIVHWGVDFFTSKVAAKYVKQPRIFYPVLGFDQWLHVVSLYCSYFYLVG